MLSLIINKNDLKCKGGASGPLRNRRRSGMRGVIHRARTVFLTGGLTASNQS